MAIAKTTPAEQTELIESAHIKFAGMSASALNEPAELGDVQEFTVRARCIGTGVELRKDGEVRHVRKMDVQEVEFGKIVKAPKDQQLALVDDDPSDD
jgi:hypothetical protein